MLHNNIHFYVGASYELFCTLPVEPGRKITKKKGPRIGLVGLLAHGRLVGRGLLGSMIKLPRTSAAASVGFLERLPKDFWSFNRCFDTAGARASEFGSLKIR